MPKQSSNKRRSKAVSSNSRPTIPCCEERFACKDDQTVAKYYCQDCGSSQCELCDALLHDSNELIFDHQKQLLTATVELISDASVGGGGVSECGVISKNCHQAVTVGKKRQSRSTPFKAERIITSNSVSNKLNNRLSEEEEDLSGDSSEPTLPTTTEVTHEPAEDSTESDKADPPEDKTAFNKQSRNSVAKKKKSKKKNSLTSSSVRNSAEQAGSEEENSPAVVEDSNCSHESSDDNNSSEGYASSGSGLNDHSKRNYRLSYHMTNGTTTTNTKLMPFDTEDQFLVTKTTDDEGNGWSDLHLGSTPPQNSDLPDVAQLSIDASSPTTECQLATKRTSISKNGDLLVGKIRTSSESSTSSAEYGPDSAKPISFLLLDEQEVMQVKTQEEFCEKLGCSPNTLAKVVSIFGNTGEGKSHTLNYTFYQCEEVFHTSYTQNSCTIGIWCAYDRKRKVITIDTEGLLGLSDNNNRRTRLLLKVLAISDIIIYRTRAERLHNDLFTFLGSASQAYVKHFAKELRASSERCNLSCSLSDLGPVVIIFQETVHTEVLKNENDLAPEDVIRQRFNALDLSTEAFSAFEYVGIRTLNPPTDFTKLQACVHRHLTNSTVRSARMPGVIFNALKVLNAKFSDEITKKMLNPFPDEYFTCSEHCLSCNARCSLSMNHSFDGIPHKTHTHCRFQHQYANQILYCRACFERGEHVPVILKSYSSIDSAWMGIAKYAWAGSILECRLCGIIYRSRQYWYGNKEPTEQSVVRTEILHVWEDEPLPSQITQQNAAQKVVDSVNYLSETVTNIGAKPSKVISSWVADKIAPAYWVPNARIQHCGNCQKEFEPLEKKHHCRRCGGGFCETCSDYYQPVPERGWGDEPVRVCTICYEKRQGYSDTLNDEVTARKVCETLQTTLGTVISKIDYPLGWIKDSARPDYWVADKDIVNCVVCKEEFTEKIPIHHCRACGHGVCGSCSQQRKSVPSRGWVDPTRVCDDCASKKTVTV